MLFIFAVLYESVILSTEAERDSLRSCGRQRKKVLLKIELWRTRVLGKSDPHGQTQQELFPSFPCKTRSPLRRKEQLIGTLTSRSPFPVLGLYHLMELSCKANSFLAALLSPFNIVQHRHPGGWCQSWLHQSCVPLYFVKCPSTV